MFYEVVYLKSHRLVGFFLLCVPLGRIKIPFIFRCFCGIIQYEPVWTLVRGRSWPILFGAKHFVIVIPTISMSLHRYISLICTGRGAVGYKIRFAEKPIGSITE